MYEHTNYMCVSKCYGESRGAIVLHSGVGLLVPVLLLDFSPLLAEHVQGCCTGMACAGGAVLVVALVVEIGLRGMGDGIVGENCHLQSQLAHQDKELGNAKR